MHKPQNIDTHMFNAADADEILPSSRNQGLKPSDDLAYIIRKCYKGISSHIVLRDVASIPEEDMIPQAQYTTPQSKRP